MPESISSHDELGKLFQRLENSDYEKKEVDYFKTRLKHVIDLEAEIESVEVQMDDAIENNDGKGGLEAFEKLVEDFVKAAKPVTEIHNTFNSMTKKGNKKERELAVELRPAIEYVIGELLSRSLVNTYREEKRYAQKFGGEAGQQLRSINDRAKKKTGISLGELGILAKTYCEDPNLKDKIDKVRKKL